MPSSRHWLYSKVETWLDSGTPAAQAGSGEGQPLDCASRMFLLLAGPGMGKSVFSAVVRNKLLVRWVQVWT